MSEPFFRALLEGRDSLDRFLMEQNAVLPIRRLDVSPRLRKAAKITRTGKVDLRGLTLMRLAMMECDLSEADLRGTGLSGSTFMNCNFSGSELGQADITGVNFSGSNFSGTFMAYTIAVNCNFNKAQMSATSLQSARLNSSFLTECVLVEADLRAANCEKVDFSNSDLSGALLRSAFLKGATLRNCRLDGAIVTSYYDEIRGRIRPVAVTDLSNAVGLTQAQVESMIGDEHTILRDDLKRPAHWLTFDANKRLEETISEMSASPPIGSSAQPSALGEKINLVKRNKEQIDLLCVSLVFQIDDELQRLRGWNVSSDEEMLQRDRAVSFLLDTQINAKEILLLSTEGDEETEVRRASFLFALSAAFNDWLKKNKEQLVDDSIRFSIISGIALLCGFGGTVIPLAAIALFGGDKVKQIFSK